MESMRNVAKLTMASVTMCMYVGIVMRSCLDQAVCVPWLWLSWECLRTHQVLLNLVDSSVQTATSQSCGREELGRLTQSQCRHRWHE